MYPMERELSLRRKRFVQLLPGASSGADAARKAGYPPTSARQTAHVLLTNHDVAAAAKLSLATAAERSGVTADWALKILHENVERSMQAVPALDRQGKPTGEYQYEPHAVNKGVEIAMRHLKLLGDDKPTPQGDTYNQVVLQGFTFEQLQELLGKMQAPRLAEPLKENREPKAIPAPRKPKVRRKGKDTPS